MKTLLFLLAAAPLLAKQLPPQLHLKAAANAFLASLDDEHRALATMPFAEAERENWHYVPLDRAGLPLAEMNDAQKNAAVTLANAILSEKGALKAAQIIRLESVLAVLENDPRKRDSERYWLLVFGEPGDPAGWGFRFEGHHLSLNITLVGESDISVTPSFMGTNPAEVLTGDVKGLRPLAEEEDLARALATTLLADGKKAVLFSEKPPGEILTGQDRVAKSPPVQGLAAAAMSESQQAALIELISLYTGRYRPDVAADDLKEITAAGMENLHFGWAGGLKRGEGYYYKIQGPGFIMEAANTQNDANHMHAVWRDFDGDFGRDLLEEHMRSHPR